MLRYSREDVSTSATVKKLAAQRRSRIGGVPSGAKALSLFARIIFCEDGHALVEGLVLMILDE